MPLHSAGILLYRKRPEGIQVLLAHMGGPYWARKEMGAWTVPKGLVQKGEKLLVGARREFEEEMGFAVDGNFIPLPTVRSGSKVIHVWALEGDWVPKPIQSNTFEMEWPPKSGQIKQFPEIDRAKWFHLEDAPKRLVKSQRPLLLGFEAAVK